MCGITAIFERRARRAGDLLRDLVTMHAQIPHRGPDGEGFVVIDASMSPKRRAETDGADFAARAALAFRWLYVQDSAPAAAQPMPSHDGRAWLIFNGEIYNHRDLRSELGADTFRSESDAETILAAYKRWGVGAFARFVGMWSLLLIDLDERLLIGSRDRFGIRPMFYADSDDRLLFASEIKQILPLLRERKIDDSALYSFLRFGTVVRHDHGTFFRGVRSVPPATYFILPFDDAAAKLEFVPYWELNAREVNLPAADAQQEIERRLSESVALTMRTPARTGSFLSGGLDSPLLTALMREVDARANDAETFSIVFDRHRYAAFDESPYIDDFVRDHGVTNARCTFDAQWLRSHLHDVTRTQEEPLVASAQVAQWRVCQLARERGARVVLDGQGADEIFAGYPLHESLAWQDRLLSLRPDAAREARILARKTRVSMPSFLLRHAVVPLIPAALRRSATERARYAYVNHRYFADDATVRGAQHAERTASRNGTRSRLRRYMLADVRSAGLRQILVTGDRAAMAHSIETRLPYLDHRLVELALALPNDMKVGFGERKRILRAVARGRLPQSIMARNDKMGFVTPEPLWLRSDLREDVAAMSTNERLASMPHLNFPAVRRFIRDFSERRNDDSRAIWRLMTLSAWMAVFDITA